MECCRNHRSIDANVEEHTLREFPSDSKFGGGTCGEGEGVHCGWKTMCAKFASGALVATSSRFKYLVFVQRLLQ